VEEGDGDKVPLSGERLILTEGKNDCAENGELLIPGLTHAKPAWVCAAGR